MMLDTVEKENAPKIAEIDGKIKAHNDIVENLSKVESNSAVMMAELDDAGRRVDDAEKSVSEAEKRLNEARSEKEIRMRENAAKSGPAAWIGKMMEKAGWDDDVSRAEKEYAAATQELSDARANRDRVQADCDQATLELNRLSGEAEKVENDGGIERLNRQRSSLLEESENWKKIINDEYAASVKNILADYPDEATRYLELERNLEKAIAESDDAYRDFADEYVENGSFNSGCASMTAAERKEVVDEVLGIIRGRFSPSRDIAKDDPIGLDDVKGSGKFEPKRFESGSYTVSVEKVEPGTECYNYLEDNEYVTDNDRCFIVTGTAGEQWPINGDKLKSKYGIDPDSIEVGERVSASVTGGGNEEHVGNGGYSKEFTNKDGHRCRVSRSTGDMQVWVEGYTRVRKHKLEFVGSHWRTVGRAARTVS